MGDRRDLVAGLRADSDPYDRYTSRAADLVTSDPTLQRAKAEFERFVATSHGEVLAAVDADRLFLDSLYYDYAVDRLLARVERAADFELANPGVSDGALPMEFGAVHDRITDGETLAPAGAVPDLESLQRAGPALLRDLYESVVSRDVRLALGQYYTPRGIAELAVEHLAVEDPRTDAVLDPGCGSGVFLAACIDARRTALEERVGPAELVDLVTDTVVGVDLNPVAVRSAKLAYVLALLPEIERGDVSRVEAPVYLADALGLTREGSIPFGDDPPTVDHLVGNPPWIPWERLPERVKAAWRERYVEDLDLFPHGGSEARLGHGNDDVSVSFAWVCLHRYLARGGSASFVLKRGLTKGPAGRLFRSGRVGERPVAVERIHDFGDLRPFGEEVDADAALYALTADADQGFPVPTRVWTAGEESPDFSSATAMEASLERESAALTPVGDDPRGAWVRTDAATRALGDCAHEIRHGVKDDARAVYEIDRDQLAASEGAPGDALESDHVYPYLKSRHVVKYGLFGHDLRLVPQRKAGEDNERRLRESCPATYRYLAGHRDSLEERSSSWLEDGPFYGVFGLGEYTWAPYKVVWCRLGFKPHFAVVSSVEDPDLGEKPVVPGDHFLFVPTDDRREAHFLCALLNSAAYQETLADVAGGGKSSLSKSVVSKLRLPAYPGTGRAHRLADLSVEAHGIVPEHTDASKRAYNRKTIPELDAVQADIDETVESMLVDGELARDG